MLITSIFDLIPNCPNPAPVNVVPFYDGCNRSLVQIPAGSSCPDVLACLTGNPDFIGSILTSNLWSLVITGHNIDVNMWRINSNLPVSIGGLNGCQLTIGTTTIDLCSILSNVVYHIKDQAGNIIDVGNNDTVFVQWVDGMRFYVTPANILNVGLPLNRQHMQVLTRDDVNKTAYRENNQCCAQTLSFDTATNILSISGTNAVDLTSINTDNQELLLAGNILSITQLNSGPQSVDLTNVNEHTLGLVGNLLDIYGSDGLSNFQVDLTNVNEHTIGIVGNLLTIYGSDGVANAVVDLSQTNEHTLAIHWYRWCPAQIGDVTIDIIGSDGVINNTIAIPPPKIACCNDVMDCPGIQTMIADIANLILITQWLQNQIDLIQSQLP